MEILGADIQFPAERLDYGVIALFAITQHSLQLLPLGDVFHGQEDDMRADIFPKNLPGIEHNNLAADTGKIVFDFIAVKHGFIGKNPFK